jgi:hypothetical protein
MLRNKINNYQLVKIIVLFHRRIKPLVTGMHVGIYCRIVQNWWAGVRGCFKIQGSKCQCCLCVACHKSLF